MQSYIHEVWQKSDFFTIYFQLSFLFYTFVAWMIIIFKIIELWTRKSM